MNEQVVVTKNREQGRRKAEGFSSPLEGSHPHTSHPAQVSLAETPAGVSQLFERGIDWPVVAWIAIVHLLALAAPFFFSWQALIVCAVLIVLTGSVGVCMGYHRCLTHGSFKTYRPVRWLLAFLGGLSGEGSVLTWVANHRKHHYHSDKDGDPHSPRHGKWWSHMLWFMPNFGKRWHRELARRARPSTHDPPCPGRSPARASRRTARRERARSRHVPSRLRRRRSEPQPTGAS